MMGIFNKVNLKQFTTLKYITSNLKDDHSMATINCEIRSDKLDTPYYLDTEIAITHCTGMYNKGILHAMDVFKHHRMYNLREIKYNEIKEMMDNTFNKEDKHITIEKKEKSTVIKIETMTVKELQDILVEYEDFFRIIDELA